MVHLMIMENGWNQKNYVTTLEDIFLRLRLMLRMDVLLDLAMR